MNRRLGAMAVGLLSAGAILAGCARPEDRIADRIESLLTTEPATDAPALTSWPSGAAPLRDYVRFYQPAGDYDDSTLPITTIADPTPRWPNHPMRRVVVAVYVREGSPSIEGRSAGRVQVGPDELPEIFHGGCEVVNVIYDPRSDAILGVWCNVDGGEVPLPPEACSVR